MSQLPVIEFAKLSAPKKGVAVVLTPDAVSWGGLAATIDPAGVLSRAAGIAEFKGKAKGAIDVIAPAQSPLDRIVAIGTGPLDKAGATFWLDLGGAVAGKVKAARQVAIALETGAGPVAARDAAEFALGYLLRSYDFRKYKTVRKENGDDDAPAKPQKVTMLVSDVAGAKASWADAVAVANGVMLARDLVNEPANVLGPVEFAQEAQKLEALGVDVEILTEKEMRKLKMGALLGVAQGSVRPPRLAIMRWNGGKAKTRPVAFIGKGVVFDTGGISIKPAAGMEDMKGDMGGAAAVIGVMHVLAARKAKVNAVGILGLVENMPDGNAQRPGDIVTSMSGQTIEIINTDAEGRLVLADALHYCRTEFEPRFMVNLATLTGAILIALGQQYAGMFSNDDELANRLGAAGDSTGEKVWRMPMGPDFDKMIDSKFADMKNTGGRNAGAITAAQFLKRYVADTPWAHLDVAGTAMSSPSTDINQSWASGFGVRLLDRLVRDNYED